MQGAVKSASAHKAVSLWVLSHSFWQLGDSLIPFSLFWSWVGKRNIVSLWQHERDPETERPSATWGHNLELYFMFYVCVGHCTVNHHSAQPSHTSYTQSAEGFKSELTLLCCCSLIFLPFWFKEIYMKSAHLYLLPTGMFLRSFMG